MADVAKLMSVITVVYNGVATLEETILSVINQDYERLEYIIIDGGSTDGTVDIIKKYQDRIAYWISEKDKGIYDAMNKGKKAAKGDWCLFLGADDVLMPGIVKTVVPFLSDARAVYYGNIIVKNSGRRYDGAFSKYKLCFQNICHQCVFFPADVYRNLDYDLKYRLWADYVYNMTLWGMQERKFVYIDLDITVFNDEGIGSLNQDVQFMKDRNKLVIKNFGFIFGSAIILRYTLSKIRAFLRKGNRH